MKNAFWAAVAVAFFLAFHSAPVDAQSTQQVPSKSPVLKTQTAPQAASRASEKAQQPSATRSGAVHTKLTPTYLLIGPPKRWYCSTDGAAWENCKSLDVTLADAYAVDQNLIVMTGSGKTYITENGSRTWTEYPTGTPFILANLVYIPPDRNRQDKTPRFIALAHRIEKEGDTNVIFVSGDNGRTWRQTATFTGQRFEKTESGKVIPTATITGSLETLAADGKGRVAAAGTYGFVYSADYGETWKTASWIRENKAISLSGRFMLEAGGRDGQILYEPVLDRFVYAGAGTRGVYNNLVFGYSEDGGATWRTGMENLDTLPAYTRQQVLSKDYIFPGRLYRVGNGRVMAYPQKVYGAYFTDDGGKTWFLSRSISMPADVFTFIDIAWDGKKHYGIAYSAGTGVKRLCTSADGGFSWTPVELPAAYMEYTRRVVIGQFPTRQ